MAEKTGAGGKPQEYDTESGRYGGDGGEIKKAVDNYKPNDLKAEVYNRTAESNAVVKFSEDLPPETIKKVKDVEKDIQGLDYEVGGIISKDGKVLKQIDGSSNEVLIEDDADIKLLKDAVFTHNHPNGTCFSNNDIKSFLECDLYQLRATTSKGKTYVLTKIKDFVLPSLAYNYKKSVGLGSEGAQKVQELYSQYVNSGYSGYDALLQAESDYREEWLTKHAKDYNVKFEVIWDD